MGRWVRVVGCGPMRRRAGSWALVLTGVFLGGCGDGGNNPDAGDAGSDDQSDGALADSQGQGDDIRDAAIGADLLDAAEADGPDAPEMDAALDFPSDVADR